MKRILALSFLAACAPAATTSAPAAGPAPAPAPATTTRLKEAPRDWHLLDETTDHVPGISERKAERDLLANKPPRRTVIVAVIDNGIDTAHVDLRANLWSNPKEVPGNGTDDDNNGYVDDVRGWDFIGGKDGKFVDHDTFEITRLYARCGAGGPIPDSLSAADKQQCPKISEDFRKKKEEVEESLGRVREYQNLYSNIEVLLRQDAHTDSISKDVVEKLKPSSPEVAQAKSIYLQMLAADITPKTMADAKKELEGQAQYSLNPKFDPRGIVGDDYVNVNQRNYGNPDVTAAGAMHGTHVSGIIGAVRDNKEGVDGIAPAVRLMAVRAVPDGDERDKDIANAIRYAVDNGAQVINMSFGKAYSPQKGAVDEAVRYADSKGVLMVHAAGNEGEDAAKHASFPTPNYLSGGRAQNWIEVGATSWHMGDSLVANFSNYGQNQVDVFAPGVDIYSTVPKGYDKESGTSMASPVVAGLAALIMSYYPQLTAAEVKRAILESSTKYPNLRVLRPGEGSDKVPFSTLSVTGGIVNAYAALKMAEEMSKARP
ncbi:MAG TPA: S8 family peptidase [Gemmatimonadaceae bacterium]|nr:S8 family peptidase [Gemmatimonadaceae bacterium]